MTDSPARPRSPHVILRGCLGAATLLLADARFAEPTSADKFAEADSFALASTRCRSS